MLDWILSFFYALGRFALGLLLHPYQTMQMIAEHRLFVWLTLLPTLFLALITLLWKIIVWFFVSFLAVSLVATITPNLISIYSFITTWIVVFCVYWQLMLFYLFMRFKIFVEANIKADD